MSQRSWQSGNISEKSGDIVGKHDGRAKISFPSFYIITDDVLTISK